MVRNISLLQDAALDSMSFRDLPNSGDTLTTPDATSPMAPNPSPDSLNHLGGFDYLNPASAPPDRRQVMELTYPVTGHSFSFLKFYAR
ncbi:hypothetical protein BC827DRAFT_1243705 [Russula dissimulans]|nr:hypothetical protein BC827DRAFT_1243705 [Russula dissimulans]